MPSLQDTKFYVVRADGSCTMEFYLTPEGELDGTDIRDAAALLHRLNGRLEQERRGGVSFGKRRIGESDGNDRRRIQVDMR